jgi:hypothetical protein
MKRIRSASARDGRPAAPRQASTDNRPARPAPIHIYNTLPPRKAAPKHRINMDHVTAKLDAVITSAPTAPVKQAAVEAIDVEERHDTTPARLAEMNRRNFEYWFGAKR